MRIIHLIRKPQPGYQSFERLFADIRKGMPDDIDIEVVHCWFHSRGFIRRLLNVLQAALLRRADVVHITGDVHYVALGFPGKRRVLTIHDIAPLRPKRGLSRWLFALFWYRLPMRCASVTTTVSEFTRSELAAEARVDVADVVIIPNCVSPEFTYCPKPWPAVPNILMVGTKPQKNLPRMFHALAGLDVRVTIIGKCSPELQKELQSTVVPFTELGRVDDAGLVAAYRDCDMLAFASTYEGFGMPILEAQATGRPVLTSNCSSMPEAAGVGGAVLVDPYVVADIGRGFSLLVEMDRNRLDVIEAGSENAATKSVSVIADAYAAAYRRR